jgi:uncharacterized protein
MFLVVAGAAVLLGAAVQGSVGLGLGLVAAPVVSLLQPSLMPGSLLIATALLPVLTLTGEWRHVDYRGVSWALVGRLAGTAGGVWVVATLAPKTLGLVVGVMVLIAVVLTASTLHVRPTPRTLSAAGVVSGVAGTATSIGGPPIALVYQHDPGPRVRASLAAYFVVGVCLSLGALAIGGQLPREQVTTGLALLPFVVVGFMLAQPLRRYVDGRWLRSALLVVVTVSGVVLVIQSLL